MPYSEETTKGWGIPGGAATANQDRMYGSGYAGLNPLGSIYDSRMADIRAKQSAAAQQKILDAAKAERDRAYAFQQTQYAAAQARLAEQDERAKEIYEWNKKLREEEDAEKKKRKNTAAVNAWLSGSQSGDATGVGGGRSKYGYGGTNAQFPNKKHFWEMIRGGFLKQQYGGKIPKDNAWWSRNNPTPLPSPYPKVKKTGLAPKGTYGT